jgi:hypothetical protein
MSRPRPQQPVMSATDARTRLHRLEAGRVDAIEAGLGENAVYMAELQHELAASQVAYVGLAITEIATLRAQLGGPQVG